MSSAPAGLGRRVAAGSAWSFGSRLVVSVLGLAIGAFLARLLDPRDMGIYLLALSVVPFAVVLAGAGLGQLCVRYVAAHLARGEVSSVRPTVAALWRLGLACAAAAAGLVTVLTMTIGILLFGGEDRAALGLLLGGLVFATAIQVLVSETFRGLSDIRSASLYGGPIASVLILAGVLAVAAAASGFDSTWALLIVLVATAGNAGWGLLVLRGRLRDLPEDPQPVGTRLRVSRMLLVSLPLMSTTALLTVLATVDLWVLGAVRSPEEAASYGLALRTATLVGMPLLVIYGVLGPVIAELHARGELAKLERVLRTTTMVASIPSGLLVGVFVVGGGPLLALVYGEHYRSAGLVLALLAVGQLVSVLTGVCGLLLAMTGHQRLLLTITAVCVLLTIMVLLLVVPVHGATGAAVVSASGLAVQNIAMTAAARRVTGVWTHALLSRPPRSFREVLS